MNKRMDFFSKNLQAQYFKCLRCGDCCRTSDIPITVFDIYRLARFFRKTTKSIIELCRLGYHPCTKNEIVNVDMLGVIFLLKSKPCRFFTDIPISTCKIYNVRPIVCENTPNPCNPWSIYEMYASCEGLQRSSVFPENWREIYRQLSNLHARMLSLTARFFKDTLELGQPLNELSAKFGKTPNRIVTPQGEKDTYQIIERLDKTFFAELQKHYDVMQETVRVFEACHDLFITNLKEILSKTLTSSDLKERFLEQIGLQG